MTDVIKSDSDTERSEAVLSGTGRLARVSSTFGRRFGLLGFVLVAIIVFSVMLPETFANPDNFRAILGDQSVPMILAIAALLPLAAGEFDLSIGAVLGFSAIAAINLSNAGLPLAVVIVLAVLIGMAAGAVNAFLVVGVGVNAFIATLAMGTVLAGMNLWVTGGSLAVLESESFQDLATTRLGGVQSVFFIAVVVSMGAWYLMEWTPLGRYLRATGMGRDAARLSGVRTSRYLAGSFIVAGGIAALAGVLVASRGGTASPTVGPEYLLPAYAAAFLGATTIRPGYFNVWGAAVGVLLLAIGTNGLTLLGAPTWVTYIFNGVALMLAVSISVLLARRGGKAGS